MNRIITGAGYGIVGTLLFAVSTAAAQDDFPLAEPHDSIPPTIEERLWKESGVTIPSYPKDSDLIEVFINQPGSRFRYFIDAATLTVGKDGIVNYTLVARSNSGAKNVAFERMHCSTVEYKLAAYGTTKEELQPVRNPKWRKIHNKSNMRFRYFLWEYYLCKTSAGKMQSEKQIIDAIRYYRGDQRDKGFLAPQ